MDLYVLYVWKYVFIYHEVWCWSQFFSQDGVGKSYGYYEIFLKYKKIFFNKKKKNGPITKNILKSLNFYISKIVWITTFDKTLHKALISENLLYK